jgi:hypothetical protein
MLPDESDGTIGPAPATGGPNPQEHLQYMNTADGLKKKSGYDSLGKPIFDQAAGPAPGRGGSVSSVFGMGPPKPPHWGDITGTGRNQPLIEGAMAKGGHVKKKTVHPYLVGEKGPEQYVPKKGAPMMIGMRGPEVRTFPEDGTIIPNHKLPTMLRNVGSRIPARARGGPVRGSRSGHSAPASAPRMVQQAGRATYGRPGMPFGTKQKLEQVPVTDENGNVNGWQQQNVRRDVRDPSRAIGDDGKQIMPHIFQPSAPALPPQDQQERTAADGRTWKYDASLGRGVVAADPLSQSAKYRAYNDYNEGQNAKTKDLTAAQQKAQEALNNFDLRNGRGVLDQNVKDAANRLARNKSADPTVNAMLQASHAAAKQALAKFDAEGEGTDATGTKQKRADLKAAHDAATDALKAHNDSRPNAEAELALKRQIADPKVSHADFQKALPGNQTTPPAPKGGSVSDLSSRTPEQAREATTAIDPATGKQHISPESWGDTGKRDPDAASEASEPKTASEPSPSSSAKPRSLSEINADYEAGNKARAEAGTDARTQLANAVKDADATVAKNSQPMPKPAPMAEPKPEPAVASAPKMETSPTPAAKPAMSSDSDYPATRDLLRQIGNRVPSQDEVSSLIRAGVKDDTDKAARSSSSPMPAVADSGSNSSAGSGSSDEPEPRAKGGPVKGSMMSMMMANRQRNADGGQRQSERDTNNDYMMPARAKGGPVNRTLILPNHRSSRSFPAAKRGMMPVRC